MNGTQGRGDSEPHDAERDGRRRAAEGEAREHARQTGYRPGGSQRRQEPMPASHHDDLRQEAVVRNEEHAHDGDQAQPSPRAPSKRPGRRDDG